jgi:hypothetical protein
MNGPDGIEERTEWLQDQMEQSWQDQALAEQLADEARDWSDDE